MYASGHGTGALTGKKLCCLDMSEKIFITEIKNMIYTIIKQQSCQRDIGLLIKYLTVKYAVINNAEIK
jgi:hypothetical protein